MVPIRLIEFKFIFKLSLEWKRGVGKQIRKTPLPGLDSSLLRLAKINAFAAEAGTIMIYSGLRISVQMVMFHNMAHFLASFSQLSRDISAIVYAESDT